jgi:hypothetical protein
VLDWSVSVISLEEKMKTPTKKKKLKTPPTILRTPTTIIFRDVRYPCTNLSEVEADGTVRGGRFEIPPALGRLVGDDRLAAALSVVEDGTLEIVIDDAVDEHAPHKPYARIRDIPATFVFRGVRYPGGNLSEEEADGTVIGGRVQFPAALLTLVGDRVAEMPRTFRAGADGTLEIVIDG